jgi:hypothetical protein
MGRILGTYTDFDFSNEYLLFNSFLPLPELLALGLLACDTLVVRTDTGQFECYREDNKFHEGDIVPLLAIAPKALKEEKSDAET